MRFSLASTFVVALAAQGSVASIFGTKTPYNKWHETELERWLSDNDIPYPTPADRKDLENLVKSNWNEKVGSPYSSWDTNQLSSYLQTKGQQAKKGTEQNKDSLVSQVKQYWYESEDQASDAYGSVKDWIFDTWTDSQLKSFLDKYSIPNPNPRTRDSLLSAARENYQSIADKAGESVSYPGNWLYESWSESDLKAWLDERGIPAPQIGGRDKLIASIRRNSRDAGRRMSDASSSAAASAASATNTLSDALLNSWSDSQIKEWCDNNGIPVPQGSKRNELVALARKHSNQLAQNANQVASSASSYVGAATSSAGNQFAKATNDAGLYGNGLYGHAMSYVDWFKAQIGLGASSASSAAHSATGSLGASVSSASSRASDSASSASSRAGNSASSASSLGSKSVASGSGEASKSASSASSVASKSAASAKQEL